MCGWVDDGRGDVDAHEERGGGTLWAARAEYLRQAPREAAAHRRWILVDGVAVERHAGTDPSAWNVLHDGWIERLVPRGDRLTLHVACPYLRRRFAEPGEGFLLELFECTELGYVPYADAPPTSSPDVIAAAEPDFVSAKADGERMRVWGSDGELAFRYRELGLRFGSGRPVALVAVVAAAEAYWSEWKREGEARLRAQRGEGDEPG